MDFALGWFFRLFNRAFGAATSLYARSVGYPLRLSVLSCSYTAARCT